MTSRSRGIWQYLVGLLLCAPAVAWGEQPDASLLLERMAYAVTESSYQGSFVYRRGTDFSTFRMVHRVLPGGTIQEHVVSLEGFPGRIVRAGTEASFEIERGRDFYLSRSQPALPRNFLVGPTLALLTKLEDCYRLMVAGQDRIAGADAWIVSATPRDEYRYGYRFYIDSEYYLVLRSMVVDAGGRTIEELSFISLERLPQVAEMTSPVIAGRPVAHLVEKPDASLVVSSWKFDKLPPGFMMLREHSRVLEIDAAPVMQVMFSDGLARVSLFVERLGARPLPEGFAQLAGMQTYSRTRAGYQLTAVGAVPGPTLQAIVAAAPEVPKTALD